MNTFIFSILLIIIIMTDGFSQSEKIFGYYLELQKGDTVFAFSQTTLKLDPNINSKTISSLAMGDTLIVDSIYAERNFGTIVKPEFYKVKSGSKEGFIERSDVSICKLQMESGFLLANQFSFSDTSDILRLKVADNLVTKNIYDLNLIGHEYSIFITDNKGLDGISNIISIDYFSEACGMEGGITFLTWDKEKLVELIHLSSVSEAGIFYFNEKLIFPNDSDGLPKKIIYQSEHGETIDESYRWWKSTKEERDHDWINKKVDPPFRSKHGE